MASKVIDDLRNVFSRGDRVATKTGKYFVIEEVGEERIRFRLVAGRSKMSLKLSRLGHVIDNFEKIRTSSDLELAVRKVLKEFHDNDTTNEPYLYGLAQRFWEAKRERIARSSKKAKSERRQTSLNRARRKAIEEGAFDPTDLKDARRRIEASIVQRQGQPEFRRKLLQAYNGRCAISGCDCPDALEAAHIKPYRGTHTNHIQNGILLRSDIHTLFDLRKIRISPDYRVRISRDIQSTVYKEFHNSILALPTKERDRPKFSGNLNSRKSA